jgi:Ca2+-binding RTX toxin-like protein
MRIKGTGKAELLVGTSGADTIDGGAGNDVIIGGAGTDYLTGGRGADTFVFGAHSQYDIITDFNPAEGDHIVFSSDLSATSALSSATPLSSGELYDGASFSACGGTCYVTCTDVNGDGVMDTQFSLNGDNLFVLGCMPTQLHSSDILG